MPGRTVVQWDKDDCADMGLLKIDLLGLGMMAVLEDTIELIDKHYDDKVDLAHLPANEIPLSTLRCKRPTPSDSFRWKAARADGSPAPCEARKFYDIVVQVGIIRPGPIVGKMVNPYLRSAAWAWTNQTCIPPWNRF